MAQFSRMDVLNRFYEVGLLPIFYNPDIDVCIQVADAAARGGSTILEFTNRGDFAVDVFKQLITEVRRKHPQMLFGVGSIEDAPTAAMYIANGADFIVAPNFSEDVARLCNRRKIAYIPGCGTVTEVSVAEEWGSELVKLFPANTLGGPDFVKAMRGPRPWSSLVITGGVTPDEDNLRGWFSAGAVAVGMSSHLLRKDLIQAGEYDKLTELTRQTLSIIKSVRGD